MAMVDVLSTHVQTVYNTWNRHAFHHPDLSMYPSVKRQVALKRRQREHTTQGRIAEVAVLKSQPVLQFPQKPRKEHKQPCVSCDRNVEARICAANPNDDDVVNLLETAESKSSNIFVRMFSDVVHNYNAPKYNFAKIKDTVLTDERVQDAINETVSVALLEVEGEVTENSYAPLMAKYTRKAKGVVKYMHSAMSNIMLQITSYVMYKLLPLCVSSVCVHPAQVEMVKRAGRAQVPIVYVPLHRSHLDYILLILTFLNSGIRPPLTAAGINLNIPVFGILLRWLGAFYIKRRIEATAGNKDLIYRAALHSYMVQCLKAGHNIKFYIEGGRTRTGKPLLPKVGLLSVILDAFMDGTVEDVLLVPVSVNYDKLVDGNFVREALGQPKEKETFTAAMKAIWDTLNSSHGSCAINFNEPYSLKELVNSFQKSTTRVAMPTEEVPHRLTSQGSSGSLHGTDVVKEDHRQLAEYIANHVVFDCAQASAVMSTNVVAWLLLTKCRSGVKLGALVQMLDNLRDDLIAERKHLGFTGASIDVIKSVLSLFGSDVIERTRADSGCELDDIILPVTSLPNVIELSYYANTLLPHYILPSIIVTSAYAIAKCAQSVKVSNVLLKARDLITHSEELCDILQYEFVFDRPCQDLNMRLHNALSDVSTRGVFDKLPSSKVTSDLNFDDYDDEQCIDLYKLSPVAEHVEYLRQLSVGLRPLLDTYIVSVQTLYRLVGKQLTEADYVKDVLSEIQTKLQTEECLYGESCSVDPIKNACRLLKKWGVLESYNKDSIRLVYLSEKYDNRPALEELVAKFIKYKYVKND